MQISNLITEIALAQAGVSNVPVGDDDVRAHRVKAVRRVGMPLRNAVWIAVLVMLWFAPKAFSQNNYSLQSPNRKIEIRISYSNRISYSVSLNEKTLLRDNTLSLKIDQQTLGLDPKVKDTKRRAVDQEISVPVPRRSSRLREAYNELRLEMQGNYAIVFRAYNEGVAYRWETTLPGNEVKVQGEEVSFNFAGNYNVYYPREESFFSHNERKFLYLPLNEIAPGAIASLPAIVDANGTRLAIADSDVEDYPGLWLRGNSNQALSGVFPPYPLKEELNRDRDFKITQAADYIAVTKGTRTYPWRIIGIAEKDTDLISNQLVYLLAAPSRVADPTWIKPGKVAWDWWNANNIYGVNFKAGINTQTYKYYIDFASKYGIEYIILDEGWYKLGDLLTVIPEIDMPELTQYARQKRVGIILWVVWKTLDDQFDAAFNEFEKWGVQGIKVDFMQRDDQKVINFYHKVSREAARRRMVVDFHGAIRPATMTRTWPNLLSTEGVLGLEQCKWSDICQPEHNVTLPFTRMFMGPMDYTPGAMVNATQKTFAHIFDQPMSLGTRCHQLSMYVIYESPLQMLADTPSNYLREPEMMEFLGPVPTVWDETRVIDAKMGDYLLVARRKGRDWYVGAMTDWTARELEVDFSFLPEGTFQLDAFEDGPNANRRASDYQKVTSRITKATKLKISLAEGGGWVARIHQAQ